MVLISLVYVNYRPSENLIYNENSINNGINLYSITEINEIKIKLDSEQYIVLNLWASWCTPCIEEVEQLKEKYKNEITLNGYIRAIGNQFADFDYIVLGGKEMFFLEGVFLKNINSDLLLYLSVGDKFTVKGILGEKINQGVSFNVSQIITNIKIKL